MPREIRDAEGVVWTCIQAYAGLGGDAGKTEAARAGASGERLHIVCTPSGGARSVRLELAADWDASLDDDALLAEIARAGQDG